MKSMDDNSQRIKAALLFGAGGLVSALLFKTAALVGWVPSFASDRILSSSPLFLFWGGLLLCLALSVSFSICRKLGWIVCVIPAARATLASAFIFSASFFAIYVGVFGAVAVSLLISRSISAAGAVRFAVIFGLTTGVATEAVMISAALYIATGVLNQIALRAMLTVVIALDALAIIFYPQLFGPHSGSSNPTPYNYVFAQSILGLHVWGSTAFAACAGYWLATSSASNTGRLEVFRE
jgi:hypothetical protein